MAWEILSANFVCPKCERRGECEYEEPDYAFMRVRFNIRSITTGFNLRSNFEWFKVENIKCDECGVSAQCQTAIKPA